MNNKIGIMQGRLLAPIDNKIQAFPVDRWEEEFLLAKKLNLYCIEWIYEKPNEDHNPLATDKGINNIKNVIKTSNVQVKSVCLDYYMTERLIVNHTIQNNNVDHLLWLLCQLKKLNISYVVLPFVDQSSIDLCDIPLLSELLRTILLKAEKSAIEIHLETDLRPNIFKTIFEQVNHPLLRWNYDIGNSASLGYMPEEEFSLLSSYLGSVHIKDRVYKGTTVPLGTGNADFKSCFFWFEKINFSRWYILQAARTLETTEEVTISNYLNFLQINGYIN